MTSIMMHSNLPHLASYQRQNARSGNSSQMESVPPCQEDERWPASQMDSSLSGSFHFLWLSFDLPDD